MTDRDWIRGGTAGSIAASIEAAVHAGRLGPGHALPPVRTLSARLRVSPATVAAAYRRLRDRGLLTGAGRAGTRVAPHPPTPLARRPSRAAGLVDLASGNPDLALLPPLDAALRGVTPEPHLYGDGAELRPLMSFLRGEYEADGIAAGALTLVNGALDGVERILREHLRPGDAVAVEDPGFPGLLDLLAAAGYPRVPFPVDDEGPQAEGFERALRQARAVIVTPRAQNPTGAAIASGRARELRRLLRARPVLLVENDPCGPVSGAPAVTLTGGGAAPWAVIRSTSKLLGPDLRLAAVAGDPLTVARVEGRQALGPRWVSTILQRLVLALWSDPAGGRLLARAAGAYAVRREALLHALAAHRIAAHGRSGLNVWIPVRHESRIVAALAEAGWGVAAGERFRMHAAPAIRVTTASLDPADARRFAETLAALAPMGSARAAAC